MILVGKPEGKRPLGRPRRRWADNIKIDMREVGRDVMDWTDLAQNRDQWGAPLNTVMNIQHPCLSPLLCLTAVLVGLIVLQILQKFSSQIIYQEVNFVSRRHDKCSANRHGHRGEFYRIKIT
jgi:hypothetical protein